ncbi:RadC family protein [Chloroflexota bacterium]
MCLLYHSMRDLRKEVFKVIFLNSQNQIIDISDLFEGTINSSSVSPREVVESAIKNDAASLLFVHNHPSGNPEPSKSDKELTKDLVYAGAIMRLRVLDHIIIGGNRYFSFAGEGLIEQYELDFLNLKMRGVSEAKRRIYRAKLFGELN